MDIYLLRNFIVFYRGFRFGELFFQVLEKEQVTGNDSPKVRANRGGFGWKDLGSGQMVSEMMTRKCKSFIELKVQSVEGKPR